MMTPNRVQDQIRVLLIEDDPVYTRLVQRILQAAWGEPLAFGHVDSLLAGLQRLSEGEIDIILLDLSLPDSQGFETFARTHAGASEIPIVVLSSLEDRDLAIRAVREGAQDYLVKGQVDSTLLVRSMRYAIERKRTEKELREYRDHLENLVRKRTVELTRINQQLQREIVERRKAEGTLTRQLDELSVLHTVATAAAEAIDEDELIERAVQAVGQVLYPDNFAVLLLQEEEDVLRIHPSCWSRVDIEQLLDLSIPRGQGVTGQVALDGQPRLINDIQQEPAYLDLDPKMRSELCVPLIAGGEILGVVNAESGQQGAFSPADQQLLATFAGQLATGIEKIRLMDTLEHRVADRTAELAALYAVTAVTSESLDLITTLEKSLAQALETMGSQIGTIHLLEAATGSLYLAAQQGLEVLTAEQTASSPCGGTVLNWVIEHREPLVIPDLAADPRLTDQDLTAGPHTCISVPIQTQGQMLGGLIIVRDVKHQFSTEEVALLTSIADHVGVAVENARLRRQAERAAVMEERERLSRELHDSVTQSLYSLTLFAEAGRELAENGDMDSVTHHLIRIGETGQHALKEMRLLVYELRPPVLEQDGLVGALRQRLEAVEKRAGVEARLLVDELVELPPHVEEGLYRIAQEALNNALKHAAATLVTVHLHADGQQVELEVIDDGVGFDLETAREGGGMGLANMQQRVGSLAGRLTILSAPGEGTTVRITVDRQAPHGS